MKNFLFLFLFIFIISLGHAQVKAITDTGDEVILYNDGTWKYVNSEKQTTTEIKINPTTFEKSKDATFLLKSKVTNVGFWLNTKKWKFQKAVDNPAAEYELTFKNGDLYSMIVTEEVEMPLLTLRDLALENARSVAPDARFTQEEYRNVNGKKVLMVEIEGTMQGLKFSYRNYYFTNSSGSVQFVTYTATKLLKKYLNEIEELLNGFVEL